MTITCVICKREPIPGDLSRSFHRFPKNSELKQKWIEAIGLQKVTKASSVCSDHFGVDSYHQTDGYTKLRRLLSTAVPLCGNNSVIKQMTNCMMIPCSIKETGHKTCLMVYPYSANTSLDSSRNSNVSEASVQVNTSTCDNVSQALIDRIVCDTVPSFSQLKSNEIAINKISNYSKRNQSITDESIQRNKKFCFVDGCQPSHVKREDFVSDEAWGRFVKLMRYKNREITRNNKRCYRRGKQILNLKESVKSLRENKSAVIECLELNGVSEKTENTNHWSHESSEGNVNNITIKKETIDPDASDICYENIQDHLEIKTEIKEENL